MLYLATLDKRGETDLAEEIVDLLAQVAPEVVSQTHFTLLTVTGATAAGRIHRLIHRIDDLRDKNLAQIAAQAITAAGATYTGHQVIAPQFGKQLLQVGK